MDLSSATFFEHHGSLFAITSPRPFAYGRAARVDAERHLIEWGDARHRVVEVVKVVESTDDRLEVEDASGRTFVFEPMTVAFWRSRFPDLAVRSLEDVRAIVARDW